MKTPEQITLRIEDLELDRDDCKRWYDQALARYNSDKNAFGNADPSEYLDASRQLCIIESKLEELKWCLE